MIDADLVAVRPPSVWRVLRQSDRLKRGAGAAMKNSTGFEQPAAVHQHWHINIAHSNLRGTFYYLCAVPDRFSQFLLAWHAIRCAAVVGRCQELSGAIRHARRYDGEKTGGNSPMLSPRAR